MLLDLIRALCAATVAAVVPGYFWARVLLASDNLSERITYSVALSMAMVPVVALVPASVFGLGVTPAVAALSVAGVFGSGFALYMWLGPAETAKGGEEPAVGLPAPLKLPELALLGAAMVPALGGAVGVLSLRPSLIASGALVAAAGAAHLLIPDKGLEQENPDTPSREGMLREERGDGTLAALGRRALLPVVLILVLWRGYSGPMLHDWPFIRGVDHYSHDVMSYLMLTEGHIQPYLIYPPGFHTLMAVISRLSGLEPLEMFPVLAPAFLLLPTIACYALAKRLWGWEAGVAAALFAGVLVGGTYYYFQDAMYPNLIAAQFLMVVAVAALVGVYAFPSRRAGLLLALMGSSVVLYHQVSGMYLALLLALVSTYFLPYLFLRERAKGVAVFLSLSLLAVFSVAYAWGTYDLASVVGNLLGGSSGETGTAIGMAIGTQAPYPFDLLIAIMVSSSVAWLGLFGALLLVGGKWGRPNVRAGALAGTLTNARSKAPRIMVHLMLFLWILILFVGSRTPLSGFPQRFGRDLGIPIALLAALALVVLLRSFLIRRKPAAYLTAAVAVFLAGTLVGLQGIQSLKGASKPSFQLTMTHQIEEAGYWLKDHNDGGNIMVTPQANQVPSRMMLAMGDYSAMQSFVAYQITHPRDLPPHGPEPLWDVLYVLNNPAAEKTDRLLEKHDIRYVVLYKDMPDRPVTPFWRGFSNKPDLYRAAFENEDVLIVTRRESASQGSPANEA